MNVVVCIYFQGDIGLIESITLKNFMCHHLLGPFQFGPNVNFIVGNNGSKNQISESAVDFDFLFFNTSAWLTKPLWFITSNNGVQPCVLFWKSTYHIIKQTSQQSDFSQHCRILENWLSRALLVNLYNICCVFNREWAKLVLGKIYFDSLHHAKICFFNVH